MKTRRVFWIVLDSVGLGGAPDAADFGDAGSDTLGSCYATLDICDSLRIGLRNACTTHNSLETLSILGVVDSLDASTDDVNTQVSQRLGKVDSGLTTK